MVSRTEALLLVNSALAAGHTADDILRVGLTPPERKIPDPFRLIERFLPRRPAPTRDTIRRAANAIDTYADELGSVATTLDDDELRSAAADVADVGPALWDTRLSAADAHRRLAPSLGLLLKRRTYLTLGRVAGFGEGPDH